MVIRQLGFAILAVLAIAVTFGLAPEQPEPMDTTRFERQVEQALANFGANESRTSGAPQQQVVNGWVNRDLLTIISRQLSAAIEQPPVPATDPRLPYLLLILTLTVGWHAATLTTATATSVTAGAEPHGPAPQTPARTDASLDGPPRLPERQEHDSTTTNDGPDLGSHGQRS